MPSAEVTIAWSVHLGIIVHQGVLGFFSSIILYFPFDRANLSRCCGNYTTPNDHCWMSWWWADEVIQEICYIVASTVVY